jgi:putative PIN family toxin of toxin-antitoxin system
MLRAVIDTSSLVSYVLTAGTIMQQVITHWRAGAFTLLSSPATRTELAEVLSRPTIARHSVMPLGEFASGVERFSRHVPGHLQLHGVCRDPKDDKFLACAVEGSAHYLVSSDRDLLVLQRHEGIGIINPGQFLIALDLYPNSAQVLATRFSISTLSEITATVPLEPGTASRIDEAIALLTTRTQ